MCTSESPVNDLDGNSDKLPALCANVSLLTACSDVVVVSHVNVKDQLLASRLEVSLLDPVLHARLTGKEEERADVVERETMDCTL